MKLRFSLPKQSTEGQNAIITFEELKLSQPIDKDINRPKALWQVLEEIYTVLGENKITFEQEDIHVDRASSFNSVQNNNNLETGFNHKKPKSFQEWTFDNLFTKIVITDDLNEFEGAIAIAYNPFGMQLAFGLTYEGRSHFAHFGEEDTLISTAACGEVKVLPYFVMVHKIKQWFPFNNKNTIALLDKTKSLMNKSLNTEFILPFIDQFYQYAMKYDDCLEDNRLVEQSEFDRFNENLRVHANKEFSKTENLSAWDLFTLGNAILKPGGDLNLKGIIPIGYIWGGYVFSRLV